MKSESVARI